MDTLGINAAYHDPAACLVRDGRVIAAAEEERFTHVKHGKRPVPFSTWELPFHAIDYCLREAGITLADVDHVAYSYDPYLLLGRHSATPRSPCRWSRRVGHAVGVGGGLGPALPLLDRQRPPPALGGAPHHLQERFRGARSRVRSAGISSSTTSRTRRAPSTSRRSSGRP